MSETQGFPAKPRAQESMTSPPAAPGHFCGFSQTVAHKRLIVAMKKSLCRAAAARRPRPRFDYRTRATRS